MALSGLLFRLLKVVKVLTQVGLGLAVLLLAALYTYQSTLIYPASLNDGHGHCATPDEFDMPDYQEVNLKTEDGETLQCYSLKHDANAADYTNKTILILSPNAGNIGHALPIVALFYKNLRYNVFIYSYRGYGKSTGKPSEAGLKLDAQRVMEYLTHEDEQYLLSSIVLYGRSLGGAVAIYIASTNSAAIQGMVLENTFLSIHKTVPHIFPFLKYFTGFVRDTWDLESLVGKIPADIPVVMFSARNDEIVPPQHMDRLFELLKAREKYFYKFPNSTHNDTVMQPTYWDRVHDFIRDKVNPIGH